MTDDEERARNQAKAQLENIVNMIGRLEHASECDGEECELTDQEILDGLGLAGNRKATDEERKEYHNEEEAQEAISEDPLSVEVRSGWQNPVEKLEPEEFEILLCTGGPAVRIIGDLDNGEPYRARIEYQDWGTPWTEYFPTSEEREALLEYARLVVSI